MKAASFNGTVVAALEQDSSAGESYASTEIHPTRSADWRKFEFKLLSTKQDAHARLSLTFYGKGTVLIDEASLVPSDAVDGVRKEVFARVEALHPAFVRWPGGNVAQDYHWMWAIGPRDERTTWTNYAWGKEPEPSDFGTDEFIQFCRNLGAKPSMTVNVEGRGATAEEAAQWVEYANGSPGSKFGAMRAANGHKQPFRVPLWEVGNEIWGSWVTAHSDASTYGENFKRYYSAMHSVDPSIKFIAVGDNDLQWDRTVLANAGRQIDYLAIHHYYGGAEMHGDLRNLLAHPLKYEAFYKQLLSLIRDLVPGKDIKLAINEWNTSLPLPAQHSMISALYAGRLMNVFERSGEVVAMAAISDLVNGWSGGLIQAGRDSLFVTPTYHAARMYSERLGSERLKTVVTSPAFDSSREGKQIPYLDAVASRPSDGRHVFLKVVNTDLEHPIATTIEIKGVLIAGHAQWEVLTASEPTSSNTFSRPDEVAPKMLDLNAGNSFQMIFPAHSVSVITFEAQ
jgi:alpha-N-arabinofuranosidase